MPKRTLVKEENQPSITALLPNCSSNTETEIETLDITGDTLIDNQDFETTEFKKVNKRKRKCHSSDSPKDNPTKKSL